MNLKNQKIRTATISMRGQLVVPEDMRKDLGLRGGDTLVLIERTGEIIIRKESDILRAIKEENRFWKTLSQEAMKRAWGKEDEIWDKIAKAVK